MSLHAFLMRRYAEAAARRVPGVRKEREREPDVTPRVLECSKRRLVVTYDGWRLRNPANAASASSRIAQSGKNKKARDRGRWLAEHLAAAELTDFRVGQWTIERIARRDGRATTYRRAKARLLVGRVEVVLVRVAPRKLDEGCGLNSAFKALRDGVADALGFRDDSAPELVWTYRQERGPYGVRVEVRAARAGGTRT